MATRTRLVSGMILVLASARCASTTGHRANHDRMRLVSASLASARPTFVAPPVIEETFAELAREIAEHDRANEGRGEWGPSACATLAERLERVARFGPRATAGDAYAAALLVHERCNRPERAQAVLARAEALEPLSCGVLVAIGLAHERAGRFEVAQRRYANSFCVEGTVRLGRLSRSRRSCPRGSRPSRGRARSPRFDRRSEISRRTLARSRDSRRCTSTRRAPTGRLSR